MTGASVKLGLMPPLSGVVGMYGPEIRRAGQIACQEVNDSGGVRGRPLELVIEDDGSLPATAVAAANRLVDRHGCVALIGNLLSNSRIAVAYRVAEPRRIPYLNFSFYEGSILSRYFFHFAALPNQQIDKMIPYMRKEHGPRMFFAGNNYEWPRGSVDAAKRALAYTGGEAVGEEYRPIGVGMNDIEDLLDQVSAASPDVFVPYFAGEDQMRLLTRFSERGMKRRMAVVMGHFDEVMASRLPPAVRDGFYSSNTYFMTVDTAANRDCLARLAAWPGIDGLWPQGNGFLTNFGEGAYLCVKAFALAANRAGSLDSEPLVDALATIRLAGPQGAVHMDPQTHHAQVNTYLARCRADGSFTVIESFGAIAPALPERYRHLRIHPEATLEDDIRLQARMLEHLSEAVFLIRTGDGTIVYANPGAERMFGYQRGELVGAPVSALNAPEGGDPHRTAADILGLLSRKGRWEGEIRNVRKDGTPFWTAASVSAFTHPVHGEVWMSVQKDISQVKAMQAELERHRHHLEDQIAERTRALEEAKREAEKANEAKSRFLAAASHDLRQPVQGLRLFLHILTERTLDPVVARLVATMGDAVDSTELMLGRLMEFAALESGKVAVNRQQVWVDALIRRIVDEAAPEAARKGLRLKAVAHPCIVDSDPVLLERIVRNLLSNALRYTERGGVLVGLRRRCGNVAVAVYDTGGGIPEAKQTEIFEEFRQLANPERDRAKGMGLGLAIVARTADLLGHRLTLRSRPGRGSMFAVELGCLCSLHPAGPGAEPLPPEAAINGSILLVEDDAVQAVALSAILELAGYDVRTVPDAATALRALRPPGPDLIVSDYRLPDGVCGLDVIRMVRQRFNCFIPAVLTTGDTQAAIADEAALAACAVVHKPYKPQALLQTIHQRLDGKGARKP